MRTPVTSRSVHFATSSVLSATLFASFPAAARGDGPADYFVNRLSYAKFKSTIFDLASFGTRYWNKPGNDSGVAYIKQQLESFGYTVVLDPYTFATQNKYNVYATKHGATCPSDMYIVGAHLDSYNRRAQYDNAPGADDDGSGVSAVLEAARVLAAARTDTSIRFILWNNEETGLNGSHAYVVAHQPLQGTDGEPFWLGMIQLDMILLDHGPGPVPDADVEYNAAHAMGGASQALAEAVAGAMPRYGSIPAEVGNNMDFTDSKSFWEATAAVSIRENQRVAEIGAGSNPNWHEASDLYATYSESDFQFGFNIAKMLVGAVVELSDARPLGDMNCDGSVNQLDIDPFLVSVGDVEIYRATYPRCERMLADLNGDGSVNQMDVQGFADLIAGGH